MEVIKDVLANYRHTTLPRPITAVVPSHEKYSPDSACPVCGGFGWVHPTDTNGRPVYSVVESCQCLRRSRAEYMKSDAFRVESGANPAQTFAAFIVKPGTKPCFEAAQAWSSPNATFIWLLLYGGVGNGKSHLCSAALNALLDRGQAGTLRIASLFIALLRSSMNDHTTDAVMAGYQSLPYLVLDDLGTGMKHPEDPAGEWEWSRIEELLVVRYERRLPTMVSLNLDWTVMPERVTSRFKDRELSRMVQNAATDYRREK